MVDAWGGWSQFQVLLQTLKKVASKHGVSIPTVAVKYILDQVKSIHPLYYKLESIRLSISHIVKSPLIILICKTTASSGRIDDRC